MMILNAHFSITLDMKYLNAGAHYNQHLKKEKISANSKVWKRKELQSKRRGIQLFVEGQENQWYIDNRYSKHMIGDKHKLISYNALEKENNVTFGNESPAIIKGKGFVFLK